jgi:hypothetical protein
MTFFSSFGWWCLLDAHEERADKVFGFKVNDERLASTFRACVYGEDAPRIVVFVLGVGRSMTGA